MDTMPTLKLTKDDIELNAKKIPVTVEYMWDYDDQEPDFDYGSDEENAKEMIRFTIGELTNVNVRVRVHALGFDATTSLSQCFIKVSNFDDEITACINENGLPGEAKEQLVTEIQKAYKTLRKVMS